MSAAPNNPFAGRSVFLTGHTGFKGSWLAIWLHRLGARVTGYALPPATPSNFLQSGVRDLLSKHHEADIRDLTLLERALRAAAPDVVFHLAAQALVRDSYARPRETFEVNVLGTVNLLDAVRALGKRCVVLVVTSDKCYENCEQVWGYREIDPLGGHDPYSASKGAAEIVTAAYRRSFFPPERLADHGIRVASARAGNVIGGGDWAEHRIVPDIVRSLMAGDPLRLRNPNAVRPWQHVLEPLSGYLTLAARMLESDDPIWCGAWNFGPLPGEEVSVRELVDRFLAVWGEGSWQDAGNPSEPHEAGVLRLAIDKALAQLGWRPRWSLAECVERTAAWYRSFRDGTVTSMRRACEADVAAYEAVAGFEVTDAPAIVGQTDGRAGRFCPDERPDGLRHRATRRASRSTVAAAGGSP